MEVYILKPSTDHSRRRIVENEARGSIEQSHPPVGIYSNNAVRHVGKNQFRAPPVLPEVTYTLYQFTNRPIEPGGRSHGRLVRPFAGAIETVAVRDGAQHRNEFLGAPRPRQSEPSMHHSHRGKAGSGDCPLPPRRPLTRDGIRPKETDSSHHRDKSRTWMPGYARPPASSPHRHP